MRPTDLISILVLAAFVTTTGSGCVSALREPRSLEAIAAGAEGAPPLQDLADADALWHRRTLDDVVAAAERYERRVTDETVQLEALLGATRARLWIVDHQEDPEVRLRSAQQAVDLAQWCSRVAPEEIECSYLLALAIGLQARERRSTALDGLARMVELLEIAIAREPSLDRAGPHRVLALVYLRAPGWPTGPGDVDLGYEQAELAVGLVPGHPPNRMALAEALRELGEPERSHAEYVEAERLAQLLVEQQFPDAREWLEAARRELGRAEQR